MVIWDAIKHLADQLFLEGLLDFTRDAVGAVLWIAWQGARQILRRIK